MFKILVFLRSDRHVWRGLDSLDLVRFLQLRFLIILGWLCAFPLIRGIDQPVATTSCADLADIDILT